MKKIELQAQKRSIVGRKVKQLRQQKLLPANVFGKKVASVAITVAQEAFIKVYQDAGETGLVELVIDSKKRPVLIQNVQLHSVSRIPLHVDFYQVDLKEKVKAHVPIEIVGVAPAVSEKIGILLELLDEVEVEALPTDLPEKITVEVDNLKQINDVILVGDLTLPNGVVAVTLSDAEVVKIGELVTKEAQAQAEAEAAAKAQAQVETAAAAPTAAPSGAAPQTATPTAEAPKTSPAKTEK